MEEARTNASAVTRLLEQIGRGEAQANDALMALVYDELRVIAGAIMRDSPRGTLLQPTAVVHEAWLKLSGNLDTVENRRHFLAIAAKAMRQVLADHAKAARRQKRGGGAQRLTLFEADAATDAQAVDIAAFHDALMRLEQLSERQARIVELRVLGSMTIEEISVQMGVSSTTVKTDWSMARAWLLRELGEG